MGVPFKPIEVELLAGDVWTVQTSETSMVDKAKDVWMTSYGTTHMQSKNSTAKTQPSQDVADQRHSKAVT